LGQLKTADKSNEITAIPMLLELLDIENAIVTIDALGCQTKIVSKVTDKKANYLIGLKGNKGMFNEDVRLFFKDQKKGFISAIEHDKGHGRIESRRCTVTENIAWLRDRYPAWRNLNSIVEIQSQRTIKGKVSEETRYYISSLKADPKRIMDAIRAHWGIENRLHWVLDVSFNDDQSRIRKGNAPRNIAMIKKTVLNLLQFIKKDNPRVSLKAMRKLAGWDNHFLDSVLMAKF
jgi:predicted transposase YbfD/YdcC